MIKDLIKKITPSFLINCYYLTWAFLGAVFYRFPSKKLIIVGVTGTNGKSTVVEMIDAILKEAGFKTASSSSICFKIGSKEWPNNLKMTMPGRLKIQKFLRQAVNAECEYAVLEVTSEGIKQFRHRFIDFDAAVFTNITPEHIERHGGFEAYKTAKGELFRSLKNGIKKNTISIVNLDDPNADYFLQFIAEGKFGYKIKDELFTQLPSKEINIVEVKNYQLMPNGSRFTIDGKEFNLNLLGKFNIYNSLAAICFGLSQGINIETCKKGLEKIKEVPGRMEVVIEKPFTAIVDYAHTPAALENVYKTLKTSRLICVLGAAGGGRDKWKRPELGQIAANYCQKIILTDEDPYDENPEQILSEIKKGILTANFQESNLYEILDRKEAIKKAVQIAGAGDTVVITGKGSEPWMCIAKGEKIPWDDRKIVRELSLEVLP
ncbi:MAG: UDP-N-acetylmuramoyl-L-alanyl-D-glutamate--2,6-diaminopimelate ligase [Candidatus Parcubacteria bacterium]|nr:UDP-N-acetylmuramoyl-L-alanyl-D-glutamate--2,6-diaminopimelate ligase [Candidatus Parcubacteria bacterium]